VTGPRSLPIEALRPVQCASSLSQRSPEQLTRRLSSILGIGPSLLGGITGFPTISFGVVRVNRTKRRPDQVMSRQPWLVVEDRSEVIDTLAQLVVPAAGRSFRARTGVPVW
jgi:hypothetical protein